MFRSLVVSDVLARDHFTPAGPGAGVPGRAGRNALHPNPNPASSRQREGHRPAVAACRPGDRVSPGPESDERRTGLLRHPPRLAGTRLGAAAGAFTPAHVPIRIRLHGRLDGALAAGLDAADSLG